MPVQYIVFYACKMTAHLGVSVSQVRSGLTVTVQKSWKCTVTSMLTDQIYLNWVSAFGLVMSPPEGLGDILFFPGRPSVRPSVL